MIRPDDPRLATLPADNNPDFDLERVIDEALLRATKLPVFVSTSDLYPPVVAERVTTRYRDAGWHVTVAPTAGHWNFILNLPNKVNL